MSEKKEQISCLAGLPTLVINIIVWLLSDRLSSLVNSMIDKIVYPFWQDTVEFFITHISLILLTWLAVTYIGIALHNFLGWSNAHSFKKPLTPCKFVKTLYIGYFAIVFVASLIGGNQMSQNGEIADDSIEIAEGPTPPSLSPTATPWLIENFTDSKFETKYWKQPICQEPQVQNLGGYVLFKLDPNSECWLNVKLDRYNAKRIFVSIKFPDEEALGGFAGINTSCGDTSFFYIVSGEQIGYLRKGESFQSKYHQMNAPFIISLELEWIDDKTVNLYWYDENDNQTLNDSLECSLPNYVRIGAYTVSENLLEVQLDYVEIDGIER